MTPHTLLSAVYRLYQSRPGSYLPTPWDVQDATGAPVPAAASTAARWSLHGALTKHAIQAIADVDERLRVMAEAEQALDCAVMALDPREASVFNYVRRPWCTQQSVLEVLEQALWTTQQAVGR